MEITTLILPATISLLVGTVGSYLLLKKTGALSIEKQEQEAKTIVEKSKLEAKEVKEISKKRIEDIRAKSIEDEKEMRDLQSKIDQTVHLKEELLKKKELKLHEDQGKLDYLEEEYKKFEEKRKNLQVEITETVSKRSGTSIEQIKEELIRQIDYECKEENETTIVHLEEYYKENSEKIAKDILVSVIQKMSSPTSVEPKTEQVHVLNDTIKRHLVGEGAKNIKLFEELLGVDVIFNDFPNTITISCFNLVNRRIAKHALNRLVKERGPISEALLRKRIEEAQLDTDKELFAIGKDAVKKLNIKREFDPELIKIIGRLQFRTSYGQNIMRHSYEVGYVAQMLAAEIGANQDVARVAGFLHDLGKAIDQNPDIIGAHDYLTKEIMEKYGFSWEEVHAAWTHHDAEPQQTPEAILIKAADAVSAARPGARQESIDRYIERIRALEGIACSYENVEKAFAISAGRELRVIVNPQRINDKGVKALAPIIAERIEKEVAYPGQVRVNIIRRIKNTQTARGHAGATSRN